jgi:hypothetical protein
MPECYRLLAGAHDYLLAMKWLLRRAPPSQAATGCPVIRSKSSV